MEKFKQVKQTLELALSLLAELDNADLSSKELKQLKDLAAGINSSLELDPDVEQRRKIKKAVDALLKKGGVSLPDRRYEQLLIIYEDLTIASRAKFLGADQNKIVTWFPLDLRGDKSAALLLSGSGWAVEPLDPNQEGLTGNWQGYDLMQQLAENYPELDLDDY